MPSKLIEKHMRVNRLPHIWCPGCGHGILMRDVCQAIDNLNLDPDKVVIVSGIGCSSRAAGYMNYDTLHTTHGRAIAFATGVKLANPELTVIVITGDGDATAIGGNHLIHAARRPTQQPLSQEANISQQESLLNSLVLHLLMPQIS